MVLRKLMGIFACTLIIGAASFAMAGVPDLNLSQATTASGATTVVMYNLPNGGGRAFTEVIPVGGPYGDPGVDASISLVLLDGAGVPINLYPSEDMWLESGTFVDEDNPGLAYCTGGSVADFSTNAAGETEWVAPMNAGGWSGGVGVVTTVVINGAPLTGSAPFPMWHNSADINGDGAVNVSDVQKFAVDYFSPSYAFRSDLEFDNIVNLSDIPILAQAVGASCP